MIDALSDYWSRSGLPMFCGDLVKPISQNLLPKVNSINSVKAGICTNISKAVSCGSHYLDGLLSSFKGFTLSPEAISTTRKVALIGIGISSIGTGIWMLKSSLSKSYSLRSIGRVSKMEEPLPMMRGEKEKISGPILIMQRVKLLFSSKIFPSLTAMSAVLGGVFILAHVNYFAKSAEASKV